MVRILSSRFDALFEAELDFSCYRMIAGKGIMHAEVSSHQDQLSRRESPAASS